MRSNPPIASVRVEESLTAGSISRRAGWFPSAAGQLEHRDHLVVGIEQEQPGIAARVQDPAAGCGLAAKTVDS